MAGSDGIEVRTRDLAPIVSRLEGWQARVCDSLLTAPLPYEGIRADSGLARQARSFNAAAHQAMQAWPRQWAELAPAQRLADAFEDKVLLLVFGKFNAGKSSLCNFLAERFAAQGKAARYFQVTHGQVMEAAEPFQEGVTETTARLQGVQLGESLVLLDTPGLHSMTPENAALTRRFTDSADGMLWLTSSSSPGQVQELDELARELRRGKPLLPVLTRSDLYEEDEVDGEIVKLLCNKTADNRALQEADVAVRTRDKLRIMGVDEGLLNAPVSVSVYAARQQGQDGAAMEAAGFERLYAALLPIIGTSLAYKELKPAAVLLHHLDENVATELRDGLRPRLTALRQATEQIEQSFPRQRDAFIAGMWRSVIPALPALLETHAAARNVNAVRAGAARLLDEAAARASDEAFADFELVFASASRPLQLESGAGYQALADVVDYTGLHAALEHAVRERLLGYADAAEEHGRRALGRLRQRAIRLHASLACHEQELSVVRDQLLPGPRA